MVELFLSVNQEIQRDSRDWQLEMVCLPCLSSMVCQDSKPVLAGYPGGPRYLTLVAVLESESKLSSIFRSG